MISLRLPSKHPDSGIIQRWAAEKEQIITKQNTDIQRLQSLINTILKNNPSLGKSTT